MVSPPDNARESAHLIQADRHVARCKRQIARQREIIDLLELAGYDIQLAISMLLALATSLRALEQHRELIMDRLRPNVGCASFDQLVGAALGQGGSAGRNQRAVSERR